MSRRVSSPVLVGRVTEVGVLVAAMDRAAAGEGGLVVVEGEAGIGKSRLIHEFVARAVEGGARALVGACLPFADAVPYAPVAGILAQLDAHEPPTEVRPTVTDPADRFRFFQWVADQLIAAGAVQPVVVVVEDVHWADESTGDLVQFVANAVRAEPVVVVVSRRPDEHERVGAGGFAAALGELVRSGRAESLRLAPLEDSEVAALIGEILGVVPSHGLVERVVARADGNPFFAEELVAAGGGDDLPTTVGDVILQRIARVDPDTRQLLRVAAAVGRRVGHALLREIAAIDAAAIDVAVRDALRHQLLVVTREDYSFRHALGHEAVYGDLLPGERAALHERIAVALADRPELAMAGDPAVAAAELAHHWHAAGRLPETLAASVQAGLRAEQADAPIEAHVHYRRAIDVWPRVSNPAARAGTNRPWLLEHAAEAASLAGSHRVAAELADQVLKELDPDREPERHARALDRRALYLWYAGDVATSKLATAQLREGLRSVPTLATVTRLCGLAHQSALELQYIDALAIARDALAAARLVGGRAEVSYALHVLGSLEGHLGCHDDGIDRLHTSLGMWGERGDAQRVGATWHNLVEAYVFAGRATDARSQAERAIPELRGLGLARTYVALTTGQLALALVALGQWDEADDVSTAALAEDVDPLFHAPHPVRPPASAHPSRLLRRGPSAAGRPGAGFRQQRVHRRSVRRVAG